MDNDEYRCEKLLLVSNNEPFIKTMDERELRFTQIASEKHITPEIIRTELRTDGMFDVHFDRFGLDLNSFSNMHKITPNIQQTIYNEVVRLISELHSLGILHGDFHSGNIMMKINDKNEYVINYRLNTSIRIIVTNWKHFSVLIQYQ